MVWPAVITAGASLLGGLISAKGARDAAAMTPELMERQAALNKEQFEHQLTMGPTYEMAGLRAAGINPMLRYGSGGSGVPGQVQGVSIPSQPPNQLEALGAGVAGAGSSAYQAMNTAQQTKESEQRVENMRADLIKVGAEINQIQQSTSLTKQQRLNALAENGVIVQQQMLQLSQMALQDAQATQNYAQAAQASAAIRLLNQQTSTEEHRTLGAYWQAMLNKIQSEAAAANYSILELDRDYWLSIPGRFMRSLMRTREGLGLSLGVSGQGPGGLGVHAGSN